MIIEVISTQRYTYYSDSGGWDKSWTQTCNLGQQSHHRWYFIVVWYQRIRITFIQMCMQSIWEIQILFCLDQCEFFRPIVEYVGHNILCHGNCSAQSKFNVINNCPLPTAGQSLFSCIGLVNLYNRYAPYIEIRLKPLRKMVKKFCRKTIPALAWSAELSSLFTDFKKSITSSPVLAWFDPLKLTFLKTNCSR